MVEASFSPNTLSPTRLTPGATPSILTLHGLAGDSALKPWALYTTLPCPAIAFASRNASSPLVGAVVPSPVKSL